MVDAPIAAPLGRHLLLDLYGCPHWKVKYLREQLSAAVTAAGGTIIRDFFHEFSPHGVSGVVVIGESHVAIHTWPEKGVIAIDAFSCSAKFGLEALVPLLRQAFEAEDAEWSVVARGSRLPSRVSEKV